MKRILLILISLVWLSGCGFEKSPIMLVQKPAQLNERQELLSEMKKDFNEGERLSPEVGSEKESIYLKDLDGDGVDEAVAVMKLRNRSPALSLVVYKETENGWSLHYEKQINGDKLNDLFFEDLNQDGLLNPIVGISKENEELNYLFVYSFKPDQIQQVFVQSYSIVELGDLNQDGKQELYLLNSIRNESASLTCYNLKNVNEPLSSSVKLDPFVYYEKMQTGMVSQNQKGLIIDGTVGAHSGVSYLMTEQEGKLTKSVDAYAPKAFKPYPLYSRDINQDGVIEIGNFYAPKGWEDEAMVAIPWIEVYYQWNGDGDFQTIQERYTDYGNGFIIKFKPEWEGKVTIEKPDNGLIIRANDTNKILLEIRWSKPSEWKPAKDFSQLKKTDRYRYEIRRTTSQYKDTFLLLADDY